MRGTERKDSEKRAELGDAEGAADNVSFATRAREVYERAEALVASKSDWITVFREIFGPSGIAREYFPTTEEMEQFEKTLEFRAVRQFIGQLREQSGDASERVPTRMITVRIPKSLHDSICQEANDLKVSVNKLCVTRMLQRVDRQLIPTSSQKRRGRRPGAEYAKTGSAQTSSCDPMGDASDC